MGVETDTERENPSLTNSSRTLASVDWRSGLAWQADDLERSSSYAARSGLELVARGARTLLLRGTAVGLCWALVGLHPVVPVLLIAASVPSLARQFDFQNSTGSRIRLRGRARPAECR